MRIGVPKEIKPQENRIGLTPESVKVLTSNGHEVLVESNGGYEAGFDNEQYKKSGAKIANKAEDIFNDSEIIVKVKEPLSNEIKMIRENQIVFTYLHLAAAKELTEGLIKSKSVCIAYETITDNNGRLPLLAPMSAVAGRMSIQAGAHCLEKNQKGRGVLLGGAPGVEPATVVILGGGVVGENAALMATGLKAKVYVVDKSSQRLDQLVKIFGNKIIPQQSDKTDLKKLISECVLLIGGVLIPGAEAPKLITKDMLKLMKRGSVIVDVAIDQGGDHHAGRGDGQRRPGIESVRPKKRFRRLRDECHRQRAGDGVGANRLGTKNDRDRLGGRPLAGGLRPAGGLGQGGGVGFRT